MAIKLKDCVTAILLVVALLFLSASGILLIMAFCDLVIGLCIVLAKSGLVVKSNLGWIIPLLAICGFCIAWLAFKVQEL